MDVLSRCACGGAPALYAPDVKSETKYAASVVCHHCGVSMQMANHDSDPKRVVAAWNRAHPHRINTMTVNEKGLEAAQVAAREGCGLFIESQHVFCDDPVVGEAADGYGKPLRQPYCSCKGDAERIIEAYLRASSNDAEPVAWTSSGNLDGLRDHDSLVIGSMCNRQGDGWTVPLYLTAIEPVAASPGVPDGWKLVPVEPTEAMMRAAMDRLGWTTRPTPPEYENFGSARISDGLSEEDAAQIDGELAMEFREVYRAVLAAAPASPEPSPSTEDVMGEARGALAIALSAIEKAGDDLQASGAYPVGALAALIVPAEQVRTAITNIDRALSSKQRSGE